ncbi:hypothetical protein ABZ078_43770 [Streptomyces sp. NPDC006385]|uniref:hypothetical protein n=1 Tax=Streptomyces sp. NPDC006385 TaxID=3156761 RepID=UPI0033ADB1BA
MHRTTTTATLLVTVAVSALAGCMTVHYPPVPGPSAPTRPPTPRPSESAERPIVQAPAREALTLVEPSRRPAPTPSAARSASPTAPPPAPRPPAARAHPRHPRPEHREPRRPAVDTGRRPPVAVPEPIRPEAPKNADVCALGRKYGGWRTDSPESTICDQTYGH